MGMIKRKDKLLNKDEWDKKYTQREIFVLYLSDVDDAFVWREKCVSSSGLLYLCAMRFMGRKIHYTVSSV